MSFPASRKSLFGDAEEPFPHDDTAFPDVRKAHSGSAKRYLPHNWNRFSAVRTHMYSVFIRMFPLCRFCFADSFCQYFLLSVLHIYASRGVSGICMLRLSRHVRKRWRGGCRAMAEGWNKEFGEIVKIS